MEYRQNPITGDWTVYPSEPNGDSIKTSKSTFYDSCVAPDFSTLFNPKYDTGLINLTPVEIYGLFSDYRTAIKSLSDAEKTVYIHSIIKPSCTGKGDTCTSRASVVPAESRFLDKSIVISDRYYQEHTVCLLCTMVQEERKRQERILLQTNTFTAFAPFFQRFPYEIWVVPNNHSAQFLDISDAQLREFSSLCHDLFHRIYKAADNADFSIHIHHIIVPSEYHYCVHWYLEIIPWTTNWAGFEIATGMNINIALPESCVEKLSKFH